MKYTSNERGALPVLVALLVVALVAVVGFAVYNANKARTNPPAVVRDLAG